MEAIEICWYVVSTILSLCSIVIFARGYRYKKMKNKPSIPMGVEMTKEQISNLKRA